MNIENSLEGGQGNLGGGGTIAVTQVRKEEIKTVFIYYECIGGGAKNKGTLKKKSCPDCDEYLQQYLVSLF